MGFRIKFYEIVLLTTFGLALNSYCGYSQENIKEADTSRSDTLQLKKDTTTAENKILLRLDEFKKSFEKETENRDSVIMLSLRKLLNEDTTATISKAWMSDSVSTFTTELTSRRKMIKELMLGKYNNKKPSDQPSDSANNGIGTGKTNNSKEEELQNKVHLVGKSKLKSVDFNIREGAIVYIKVQTEDGMTYFNSQPITLLGYEKPNRRYKNNNLLFSSNGVYGKKTFILLHQTFGHTFTVGSRYVPDNVGGILKLKQNQAAATNTNATQFISDTINIQRSSSMSKFLDTRVYSDFFGLTNQESNGIVQIETNSKLIINTISWGNTFVLKFINPFLNLTRFDSDDKAYLSDPEESENKVILSPLALYQRSFVNVGMDMNIFEFMPKSDRLRFEVNANVAMQSAKVMLIDSSTFSYNTYTAGATVEFGVKQARNFGYSISLNFSRFGGMGNASIEKSFKRVWMATYSGELFYHPSGNKEAALFLRYNYFDNWTDQRAEFYQLQIGYKRSFKIESKK